MKFNSIVFFTVALMFQKVAYGKETVSSPTLGEAELIQSLGWGQKESHALTQFLDSVDQLGELIPQDESTTALLTEFKGNARELMAHAVYQHLQLKNNNPRIINRISSEEGLIMNFLDTLNRLLSKIRAPTSGKNKPLADILGLFGRIKNAFENPFFPMNPAGSFNP